MTIVHSRAGITEDKRQGSTGKRGIEGTGADLVRIIVPAGTAAARRTRAFEQFVQVVSGKDVLETEEGVHAFTAGTSFIFRRRPGTPHASTRTPSSSRSISRPAEV